MSKDKTTTLGASEDVLNGLHKALAEFFKSELSSADVSEKTVDQILKFLKDNEIKADLRYNKGLKDLQGKLAPPEEVLDLPFIVEEDDEDN